MNKQTTEKIFMFLNEPRTVYELAADVEISYSHLISCLKILEAKGLVKKDRSVSRKTTVWMKKDAAPAPAPVEEQPKPEKPKKGKKSKKDAPAVEDGEVALIPETDKEEGEVA